MLLACLLCSSCCCRCSLTHSTRCGIQFQTHARLVTVSFFLYAFSKRCCVCVCVRAGMRDTRLTHTSPHDQVIRSGTSHADCPFELTPCSSSLLSLSRSSLPLLFSSLPHTHIPKELLTNMRERERDAATVSASTPSSLSFSLSLSYPLFAYLIRHLTITVTVIESAHASPFLHSSLLTVAPGN